MQVLDSGGASSKATRLWVFRYHLGQTFPPRRRYVVEKSGRSALRHRTAAPIWRPVTVPCYLAPAPWTGLFRLRSYSNYGCPIPTWTEDHKRIAAGALNTLQEARTLSRDAALAPPSALTAQDAKRPPRRSDRARQCLACS